MTKQDRTTNDELLFRVLTGRARDTEEEMVEAWLRSAPEHQAQYRQLARVLGLAVRADAYRHRSGVPRVEEVVARAAIQANRRAAPRRRKLTHRWLHRGFGIAALILVGFFGLTRVAPWPSSRTAFGVDEFVTGTSETVTVGLRDGTVVRLAPKSRLRLLGEGARREVALTGRAYFAVARDEARPFRIRTTAGEVEVLGTRFDLQAENEDLRLVVVEGSVALTARGEDARVVAGEMGRVVKGNPLPVVKVTEPERLVEWVGRFLAFQETPFGEAALEIGRQYGVELDIQDAALAERTISAWFTDWTLDEVLDVVCTVVNAECVRVGDVVKVTPRAP